MRGEELLPGKQHQTDAELSAWVGANVDTGYHPVGTCRMGSPAAFRAGRPVVVDYELRVHRVGGMCPDQDSFLGRCPAVPVR